MIYRARKHIYDSVDLSKCSLDDHFPSEARRKKKINFSTHILRLTLLPFCCTLCAAITIVGEDKFETFYAIFNLIDRIQCK